MEGFERIASMPSLVNQLPTCRSWWEDTCVQEAYLQQADYLDRLRPRVSIEKSNLAFENIGVLIAQFEESEQ